MSNYNFSIKYCSVKKNADADALSRLQESGTITTVFPEVIKPIYQTARIVTESEIIDMNIEEYIPKEVLSSKALTSQDWHKAQQADRDIRFISEALEKGQAPSSLSAERNGVDSAYLTEWENYYKQNEILFRKHNQSVEEFSKIVLPSILMGTIFRAYHDNLGHQGRD